MCHLSGLRNPRAPTAQILALLIRLQIIMISDPVIATEVLNRRDFDKEWQVYKSISKVGVIMWGGGGKEVVCWQADSPIHGATMLTDDVTRATPVPRPRVWHDRRLVAALPQGACTRLQPSKHSVILAIVSQRLKGAHLAT